MDKTKIWEWGVYIKPSGKLLVVEKPSSNKDDDGFWHEVVIDEGKKMRHPVFRFTMHMVSRTQWGYFPDKILKDCEYLGEL